MLRAGKDFQSRPRIVPLPGTAASASLPGYRRDRVDAGRVDPLPPPAPPRCPEAAARGLRALLREELAKDVVEDAAVLEVADLVRGVDPDFCLELDRIAAVL
jgi:hypothetical protein